MAEHGTTLCKTGDWGVTLTCFFSLELPTMNFRAASWNRPVRWKGYGFGKVIRWLGGDSVQFSFIYLVSVLKVTQMRTNSSKPIITYDKRWTNELVHQKADNSPFLYNPHIFLFRKVQKIIFSNENQKSVLFQKCFETVFRIENCFHK